MTDPAAPGGSYASDTLARLVEILAHPEQLIQGDLVYVDGWVEHGSDGDAFRVVYERRGGDRRFGFRAGTEALGAEFDSAAEFAGYVADDLDEPLGRQWDLLVEEKGIWWWGDGYPGIEEHPDHAQLQAFVDAEVEHRVHGGPRPIFPFVDDRFSDQSTFVRMEDPPPDME